MLRVDGTGARHDVRTKAHGADLVTGADIAVEQLVREALQRRFPDHRVVGEEAGATGDPRARHQWWVDPIDGTTNFANGLPWASFSLALTEDGQPVVAVVADPYRSEVFAACVDGPATLNGEPVRCSTTATLAGTVVLTEWAAHEPWPGMPQLLSGLAAAHATSRIMGSSALSLSSVAAGRAAAAVIGTFSMIDDLAGAYIAHRAGAAVLSADGSLTPASAGIAVAAPGVVAAVEALLPW